MTTDCGAHENGVRFLSPGRCRSRSGGGGGWTPYSSDVAEALAPLLDVARKPMSGFTKFVLRHDDALPPPPS